MVFKALACCGLLCLAKQQKLCFTPLPKTLSLRFSFALVDGGQVSATFLTTSIASISEGVGSSSFPGP